jgi:hypothetical protein
MIQFSLVSNGVTRYNSFICMLYDLILCVPVLNFWHIKFYFSAVYSDKKFLVNLSFSGVRTDELLVDPAVYWVEMNLTGIE